MTSAISDGLLTITIVLTARQKRKRSFEMEVHGVCSAKARTSTQTGRKNGVQWWKRDVWHAKGADGKTLCGRDCREYLDMGNLEIDHNLCTRCEKEYHISHPNEKRWRECFDEPREIFN